MLWKVVCLLHDNAPSHTLNVIKQFWSLSDGMICTTYRINNYAPLDYHLFTSVGSVHGQKKCLTNAEVKMKVIKEVTEKMLTQASRS